MRNSPILFSLVMTFLGLPLVASDQPPPQEVVDTYFGTAVHDPYRWLEEASSPAVQSWVRGQNEKSREVLSSFPRREALARRLKQVLSVTTSSTPEHDGHRLFYRRLVSGTEKTVYISREDAGGMERVLIDGNKLGLTDNLTLGDAVPSPDGHYVAYQLNRNNADEAVLHLLDATSGKLLPDQIPGADNADVFWSADGKGFYYMGLPVDPKIRSVDRVAQGTVRFHAVGTDYHRDPMIYPMTHDSSHYLSPYVSRDGRWLFVYTRNGWTSNDIVAKDLQSPNAAFQPLFISTTACAQIWEWQRFFYIATNEGASRYQIFRAPVESPTRSHWKLLVHERPDAVLEGMKIYGNHLVLQWQKNAASELDIRDLSGDHVKTINLPGIGSVDGMLGHEEEDTFYYTYNSFTEPPQVYAYSISAGTSTLWSKTDVGIDPSRFQVERLWYPSKDGTLISMFVVGPKTMRHDGSTPLVLNGYGGFNVSITPRFTAQYYPWLETGGALAFPNLRGGGEYGEAWHEAGMLTQKQNTFDDFAAAAAYLIQKGYTSQKHLAIEGASNGGLLVAATLTQHPDLARAAICKVPLTDMIRYPLMGEGPNWIPEYGSPKNEDQFRALYAYSPYHHVQSAAYPSILLLSAANDDRVDPAHVRKFTAALQAANRSGRSVLLRTYQHAGHGGAGEVSATVEEWTDRLSFLMKELGMENEQRSPGVQKRLNGN